MITPFSQKGGLLRPWHLLCLGLFFLLAGCDGCNNNEPDTIAYSNQPPSSQIGLLIDAADSNGDFTDQTIITTSTSPFTFTDDLMPRSDGQSEIAAFTTGRPPFVLNPTFFQEGGDVNSVIFANEIVINLTVWIVDVDAVNTVTNRQNEIVSAIAYANGVWFAERAGIRVGDIRFVDATNNPLAASVRDFSSSSTSPEAGLRNSIGSDDDRINIYLIRKVDGFRFLSVAAIPGSFVAMGMHADGIDLLVHELSHSMFLQHTSGSNFNSKNIMKSAGNLFTQRQYITEGQTYRMHTMPFSALNTIYNARPGLQTVDCPHSANSVNCPPIEKRIWADGTAFPAN